MPLYWHLLRECPAPLLLVNAAAAILPRRIIAAVDTDVDGNEALNDRVVKEAVTLALQCDAQFELVHAFEGLGIMAMPGMEVDAAFAADAAADVLVIGAARHTLAERVLMGTSAERILTLARCDVLCVKPEGFKPPVRTN